MSTSQTTACVHDWVPLQNAWGKYRCSLCKALGYRRTSTHGVLLAILPYTCKVKKCRNFAVVNLWYAEGSRRKRLCRECRKKYDEW